MGIKEAQDSDARSNTILSMPHAQCPMPHYKDGWLKTLEDVSDSGGYICTSGKGTAGASSRGTRPTHCLMKAVTHAFTPESCSGKIRFNRNGNQPV